MQPTLRKLLVCFALLFSVTSCVETVVIGTVATGVVVTREKSISDTQSDIAISTKIFEKFVQSGLKKPGNSIDIMVNEKRVLLTGIASEGEIAEKATELAWTVSGVKEVIDEIQVIEDRPFMTGFFGYFRDSAVTAKIEAKVLFKKNISSVNYKITTFNKVVYLIGVAEDQDEIEAITSLISRVRGVEKVVSHIILISDRRRSGK